MNTEKGLDRRLLGRIIGYLMPYKHWVILAFCLVLLVSFLGPLRPWLIQIAIDNHIVPGELDGLVILMIALIGVLALEGALSYVNAYFTQWIGQQAIYDVRVRVFRHVQQQSLSFFDRTPIGRLITRTTSDVEALADVLSAGVVVIMGDMFKLLFIAAFMFSLNWVLALVTLCVMPFMLLVTLWFKRNVRGQYRETRKQVARLNSFMQEHVTGMQIVQLFGREQVEMNRFEKINDQHQIAQLKTVFFHSLFWPAVDIIASTAIGFVLWTGGVSALSGAITVGILIAFVQYCRQFFEPIRNLSEQFNTLQGAMAGAERIFDILDNDQSLPQVEKQIPQDRLEGEIVFDNVWFAYKNHDDGTPDWVLRGVSFKIRRGQDVAIVGATGSGKTTIISLLMRFYDIQKGRILLDGQDIRTFRLRYLRWRIGLVQQDVFLFSGSIARNIALDSPGITLDNVKQAAKAVGADKFIGQLPNGYDQDVRERGSSLSQGQRQLLSFARVLAHDPNILVLDEATSSIDTETEQMIQRALERTLEGRTSLVVAHRLSTIRYADTILVLHKGLLREQGTHDELVAAGGLYQTLYELQYREQEQLGASALVTEG
ncbi:MAG: ABC transporter ATP-binding protein [Rhodothermaceae bacterium]|nr:ABC transporter ATP-binding protein [Rhodothermaceae bacterium]MXX58299.1 ABC transporter ATP-binding protein [Rhodothermaceae bacterium]MYD18220.1 ABC transporter ATP-binding protein [Rhodothermaceae bacterium]MYD57911.1 ABC transporter ATP-binding protein [Rhodothermaceae bacterium]MYI44354.1 ABC transporter ATP-binding protein [Rhodothermaceae bacterium]